MSCSGMQMISEALQKGGIMAVTVAIAMHARQVGWLHLKQESITLEARGLGERASIRHYKMIAWASRSASMALEDPH